MSVGIWLILAAFAALVLWIFAIQPFRQWWCGDGAPEGRAYVDGDRVRISGRSPRSFRILFPYVVAPAVIAGALVWVYMPEPFPADANWAAQLLGRTYAFLFCYLVGLYGGIAIYSGIELYKKLKQASPRFQWFCSLVFVISQWLIKGSVVELGGDFYKWLKSGL